MSDHNDLPSSPSRRRFLRCAGGAALSLPWLESVAGAKERQTAKPAQRMAFFYLPNGITRRGFFPGENNRPLPGFAGQNNVWRFEGKTVPTGKHPLALTPTLEPLDKMRDKISLITGMGGFATRKHVTVWTGLHGGESAA